MGLDLRLRYNKGDTLLHLSFRSVKAINFLCDNGAEVDAVNAKGQTPLILACHYARYYDINSLRSCKALILRGADPYLMDMTALKNYACEAEHFMVREPPDREQKKWIAKCVSILEETCATVREVVKPLRQELSSLRHTLSSILFSDKFSDVVFVCGSSGDRIHAHRNIVAACSEQLSALLQGQWAETTGGEREYVAEVSVEQPAAAVRTLLRFMYTCEVAEAALSDNILDVLDLVMRYEQRGLRGLEDAREKCALHALTLSNDSVVPLLEAAHMHDLSGLKQACLDCVASSPSLSASAQCAQLLKTHADLASELQQVVARRKEKDASPLLKKTRACDKSTPSPPLWPGVNVYPICRRVVGAYKRDPAWDEDGYKSETSDDSS
jgi:hypothetical protein